MSEQEQFPEGAAQAAFDAIVAGEKVDIPASVVKEEESSPEVEAATVVETVAESDPWDGVPSVLKDHISQLESQLSQALAAVNNLAKSNNELKSNIGRIDSIQSELAKVKPPEVKQEKWDRVKEEYDDIAEGLEERLAALQMPSVDVDQLRRELALEADSRIEAYAREAREMSKLERKYPDWDEIVTTPDFANKWLPSQAPGIQALVNSQSSEDAIRLLDMYKESRKQTETPANNERLARAVAPSGNSTPVKKVQITAQEAFDQHFAGRRLA